MHVRSMHVPRRCACATQVRVLRPECFATAEWLLRGMAPHALVATGAGAAAHVRQLAAAAGAAAAGTAVLMDDEAAEAAALGAIV